MILAIFAVIWFLLIHPVYALSPPILSEPPNNSVIYSGPKMSWQAVIDSSEYKIMIDDESSITSPYAKTPYYTKNTYYSPKLNTGSYYWKVGAKDSSGTWFWSDVWSFTLQSNSPIPTPSPAPTPVPSASSTTSSSSTSSFTTSNIPSQINSDQSFRVTVNLSSPNNPFTSFYLKGAFKKSDSSNYFGQTLVSGNWIKNSITATSQLQITTDTGGNWTGNIEVQPDSEDSGFTGTGDYIFKVGRYTSTGSGPTWSNESNIQITAVENTDQGGISSDNSSSNTAPSSLLQSGQSAKSKAASPKSKSYDRLVYHSASVAAATTSASPPNTPVKIQQPVNFIVWIGAGLILTGIGLLAYIYLRGSNLHETISNLFRKRN